MKETRRLEYGPLLGLSTTVLGLLGALILFPDQPAPAGALMPSATVLAVGIAIVPMMRFITLGSTLMNAENFVALGYIGWLLLDLIQGAYDLNEATDESLRLALIAVGVSAAAMWAGSLGHPWKFPKWLTEVASRPLDDRAIDRLIPICFALGMFNFLYSVDFDVPAMFSYLGQQRWAMPWGRGQLGGWGAFRDQMPYFGYVLPSLTALAIARRGFRFQTLMAIGACLVMLLFLSTGGGRRVIAVTVGAALIVWVQAQPGMAVRKVITVTVGALALVWTMQFMLNIRSSGYEAFMERGSEYDYLHVDDNFLRLAQTIQLIPDKHDYVYFQQVIFTLIRPVPRVLWPSKPVNAGFDIASEVGMRGVSLSTSIVGEWYLSWGWVAVLFGGWLHGRLASSANVLRSLTMRSHNPIVFALAVMVLVAGQRSMQDLVVMSYALVAWWGVNRLVTPRASRLAAA